MNNKSFSFLAGCQKTGSTWLYKCFQEHPEVYVPEKDAIHYFTINYYKGKEWYKQWFGGIKNEKVICDPTPSYIREPLAAERIYEFNPKAKLIFTLRNPIERSFSHYWHQKRKKSVSFNFTDTLTYNGVGNIDLYDIWIRSSFYYDQLLPYFNIFPRDQLKVLFFEDLKSNPKDFLVEVLTFLDVDVSFEPSVLHKKINSAPQISNNTSVKKRIKNLLYNEESTVDEYKEGVPQDLKSELIKVFEKKNKQLEDLIQVNLSHWNK